MNQNQVPVLCPQNVNQNQFPPRTSYSTSILWRAAICYFIPAQEWCWGTRNLSDPGYFIGSCKTQPGSLRMASFSKLRVPDPLYKVTTFVLRFTTRHESSPRAQTRSNRIRVPQLHSCAAPTSQKNRHNCSKFTLHKNLTLWPVADIHCRSKRHVFLMTRLHAHA